RSNAPGRPFGHGLRWVRVAALSAAGVALIAVVLPMLYPRHAPVSITNSQKVQLQQCTAGRERLADLYQEVSGCMRRLNDEPDAPDNAPRDRMILNPISNQW